MRPKHSLPIFEENSVIKLNSNEKNNFSIKTLENESKNLKIKQKPYESLYVTTKNSEVTQKFSYSVKNKSIKI